MTVCHSLRITTKSSRTTRIQMRKTLAVRKMLAVLAVVGLTWLGAGCGGPKGTAEYKTKTAPVVALLDKLKAEGAG